ncbi:MAG: ABC transporter permease, partial [Bacilli bacterium]|nr:ABC transporter permease [Bacilli bacterium]
ESIKGFINMSSTNSNTGFFVVPDAALNNDWSVSSIIMANYADNKDKEAYEEIVAAMQNNPYMKETSLSLTSKISLYTASVGLGAMVTFIGLYLGIIFLISSAAILALKELSESADNKERFKMLRKMGADEKMLNHALFKQIAVFFMFPLLLAIIHSIFGIKFCNLILTIFGDDSLLPSIIMTAVFLMVIYGGYFLITYFCSKNIIKERN